MTFTKTCCRCGATKSREDFYSYVTHRRGQEKPAISSGCKECMREYAKLWRINNQERKTAQQRTWYAKNKHRQKGYELKKSYGMTVDEFNSLLKRQGGACAICQTAEAGGKGTWHVDHNHATKAVRGLLCHACNTGIGSLKDDVALMQRAIDYLLRI